MAPAFIASKTVSGLSYTVSTMHCILGCIIFKRRIHSIPFIPGNCTSNKTISAGLRARSLMASSALAKRRNSFTSIFNCISSARYWRILGSSSMIAILSILKAITVGINMLTLFINLQICQIKSMPAM